MGIENKINDFKQLSKFEINKLVCEKLGYQVQHDFLDGLLGFTEAYHNKYPDTVWAIKHDMEGWEQLCPTNDAGDAWEAVQAIFDSGITLVMNNSGVSTGNLGEKYNGHCAEIHFDPTHAAMILFLALD